MRVKPPGADEILSFVESATASSGHLSDNVAATPSSNRRTVVRAGIACSIASTPLRLLAQQPTKLRRIGVLIPQSPSVADGIVARVFTALRERGYDERSIAFDVRATDGDSDRLRRSAEELVALQVDLIVAVRPPAIIAARRATKTIPIVMVFWGGPGLIESGTIKSLGRPGTNVTGMYMLGTEMDDKRMQLLLVAVPTARRIAMLGSLDATGLAQLRMVTAAAKAELFMSDVPQTSDGYDRAFESFAKARTDAVCVASTPRFTEERAQIIAAAAKYRLPAMYPWSEMARDGGMMAYSPVLDELYRRAAAHIDRIFKGADPASLPVEQPTRFELVINLKTAKALGVSIPQPLLVQADEVIE